MQAINHTKSYIYDNTNARGSLLFKVDNEFQSVIGLIFLCNSTCNITENAYLVPKNRQSILLVVTLETSGLIIGRSSVEITTQNKFQNQMMKGNFIANPLELSYSGLQKNWTFWQITT